MGAVLRDKDAGVVINDDARGIVIVTWFGDPSLELIDRYYAQHREILDRHRKEGRRFILITDTFATARPNPAARKRIAEGFAALGPDVKTITMHSYIIVDNALIRGVLTALGWLDERLAGSVIVGSPSEAITAALRDLEGAGIPRPTNISPSTYMRPSLSKGTTHRAG